MTKKNLFTLVLCLFCLGTTTHAQHIPTLEEAVYGGLIKTEGGSNVSWMKDGERYSKIEKNAEGAYEVTAYKAKDNSKEVLIPANMLLNPQTGKPISVRNFIFSEDNSKVLIYTNTRRVWRYDTRGDYWVLNLKNGKLQQLGKSLPEATLMFAKFSPDASRVAYVSRNNIYVESLADGKINQLTQDGNNEIVNGTFDWVYEEEFNCRDGFRWSPDGQYIAYWQSDTQGTGWFDIINNVDSIYPKIQRFPYPKAGTANSAVKVGYVSADGGNTTWLALPGDARNHYIPRMEFIPGCNELFIQQMNRAQNTNKVWIAKIGENTPVNIFTDQDAAWLEMNDNVRWLKGNKYFTWESERDGWRHLYRVSRDGKEIKPITQGAFDYIQEVQARGIQDLARQYSFIDTTRIGITGWSGGGSQTLNSMFRYPDVFHTGIAIAFVADQRLYDTIYQERYMNTPQNNPEGYRKGSPISYAAGLKGNLLLIHGTGDDNVHYQNCEMLVNELVRHGKIFSQISYPMRSHGIYEGEGTSLHLRKTMADYWLKNLPAGGK